MSSEAPAYAPFHLSDCVNFEFNAETLNLPFACADDPSVAFDDAQNADFDGFIQLADGTYRLDNSVDATSTALAEYGNPSYWQAPTTDFSTSQTLDTTDTSRKPMAFADGIELAAQEMPRSASRWVPASPKLQQHLNTVYASQLRRLATDPNPPPFLYLSAEDSNASYMPSIQSPPNEDLTRTTFPQMLLFNAKTLSVNPPSLMHRRGKEISPLMLSNATNHPTLSLGQRRGRVIAPLRIPKATNYVTHSITNAHLSNAEHPTLNSTKKRSLKANDGPPPKRAKTAKSLSIAVHNEKADDELDNKLDDESKAAADGAPYVSGSLGLTSARTSQLLPPTATTKGSSVPSTRKLVSKRGPNWRYEQTAEVRLRNQRRKEWVLRRASEASAQGKVPNGKRQKLLQEIEDTEEFAEAQGYEVRASVGRDAVQRRPVREGAKKSYAGLA